MLKVFLLDLFLAILNLLCGLSAFCAPEQPSLLTAAFVPDHSQLAKLHIHCVVRVLTVPCVFTLGSSFLLFHRHRSRCHSPPDRRVVFQEIVFMEYVCLFVCLFKVGNSTDKPVHLKRSYAEGKKKKRKKRRKVIR